MSLSLLRSALIACQASLCRTNQRLAVARPQVLALPSFLLNTDCRIPWTHIDEDIVCKVAVPMDAVVAHVTTTSMVNTCKRYGLYATIGDNRLIYVHGGIIVVANKWYRNMQNEERERLTSCSNLTLQKPRQIRGVSSDARDQPFCKQTVSGSTFHRTMQFSHLLVNVYIIAQIHAIHTLWSDQDELSSH